MWWALWVMLAWGCCPLQSAGQCGQCIPWLRVLGICIIPTMGQRTGKATQPRHAAAIHWPSGWMLLRCLLDAHELRVYTYSLHKNKVNLSLIHDLHVCKQRPMFTSWVDGTTTRNAIQRSLYEGKLQMQKLVWRNQAPSSSLMASTSTLDGVSICFAIHAGRKN